MKKTDRGKTDCARGLAANNPHLLCGDMSFRCNCGDEGFYSAMDWCTTKYCPNVTDARTTVEDFVCKPYSTASQAVASQAHELSDRSVQIAQDDSFSSRIGSKLLQFDPTLNSDCLFVSRGSLLLQILTLVFLIAI